MKCDLNKEPLYCLFEVGAKVKLRPGSEPFAFHRALRKQVLTIVGIKVLANVGLCAEGESYVHSHCVELNNGKVFSIIDLMVWDEENNAVLETNQC